MTHRMHDWLIRLGARQRKTKYILDGFDTWFYLVFDAADDRETKEADGTVDVLLGVVGTDEYVPLLANANESKIARLLFALGVSRFSTNTKRLLYEMSNPLRDEAQAAKDGG